jgi:hypothetical protein
VALVGDAIGHAQEDRRAMIFEWLVADHESGVLSADQVRGG